MIDYKNIILEYQDFINTFKIIKRNYSIDKNANYVITGVRRAGKTWFLFQIMKELYGKNKDEILYVNFEDERFINFKHNNFNELLNAYFELYPNNKPVIFLDEVQNIDGWQKFCRRVADQKYRIYITGSNAKMLSSDIATTLGGRFMHLEITPLSFPEFLSFYGFKTVSNDIYSPKVNKIKNFFNKYFLYGGFPELTGLEDKRGYLHNIYTTVLYSDIVIKNNIRDSLGVRLLTKKLAESTNDELSYNRLKNLLVVSGVNLSTNTIISWIEYLKDSFLLNEVKNINYRFSERESKKKYYFVDNGLLFALGEQANSKLLETLSYNILRKKFGDIMFFKTKNAEVDFVVPEKSLYQVSYEVEVKSTFSREVKSLIKTADFLSVDDLYIITYNHEEVVSVNGKSIKIIPIWKFALTDEILHASGI